MSHACPTPQTQTADLVEARIPVVHERITAAITPTALVRTSHSLSCMSIFVREFLTILHE